MLPRRTGGAVRPIRAESRNVTDVPRGRPSRGLSYRGGIAFGLAVVEAMLPRRKNLQVRERSFMKDLKIAGVMLQKT